MEYITFPKEFVWQGQKLSLPEDHVHDKRIKGCFVLDFSRKFDDPDLDKLPARFIPVLTLQDRYLIQKFEIILGEYTGHD